MSEIKNLEPQLMWSIFDEITKVPRPSKKEDKIIAYLEQFADCHGLQYKKDNAGNVVILKPATAGMENQPTVILQNHMDMVCEKNSDTQFDFDNDPIKTRIDSDWVKATGTTLGADCGIGMAAALAVLVSTDIAHPAIEALFTVDEETGLTGAFNLGKDMLRGKYLLNLDSEEGEICIGCSGGIDTVATFKYRNEPPPTEYEWFRVDVSGLKGGHSGGNINDGLGNSNKILTRMLLKGTNQFDVRLSFFDGGNLRNAIPRESYALFGASKKQSDNLLKLFREIESEIANELKYTDEGFKISIQKVEKPEFVIDETTQRNLLESLQAVSNGVLAMSYSMPGLVETSSNLASVKFSDTHIKVTLSQRSSIESAKHNAASTMAAAFRLAGAEVVHGEVYPGWTPNPDSELLKTTVDSYERLFGKKPIICATHGGHVDETYQALSQKGLKFINEPMDMPDWGARVVHLYDPEENLIELYTPLAAE